MPKLHRILGGGLLMLFVGLAVLTFLHVVPLLEDEPYVETVAFAGAGIVVLILAVVVLVLKPRVPVRRLEQTPQAFWAQSGVTNNVQTIWFLIDGAATLSAVMFALTGHHLLAVTLILAIAAFWWMGPRRFEDAS